MPALQVDPDGAAPDNDLDPPIDTDLDPPAFDADQPIVDDDQQFGDGYLPEVPYDQGGDQQAPPDLGYDEDANKCSAERKQGAFMSKSDGPITRQQAIEFINLQRWAREGFCTFIFVMFLWLAFCLLADVHSHINVSYSVYRGVTKATRTFVAKASRGIAPNAIFSAAGESMCSCTCPALCSQTIPGGVSYPGVPLGAPLFNGTVTPDQLQNMRSKANYLKQVGKPEKMIRLKDVNTIPDVWFWLQHGMVPELWHEESRALPVDTTLLFAKQASLDKRQRSLDAKDKPGHFMRWNQVIGGVRLRQRRLHTSKCRANNDVSDQFNQKCHTKRPAMLPFGPGMASYAEGFVPDDKEKGAFDIYLDTERPVHIALETLQFMLEAHHWLDPSSKSLQVQIPMINAEVTPALYGILEIRFDFTRGGDLTKKVDLWTSAVTPYAAFTMTTFADVIFFGLLVYLMLKRILQAMNYFLNPRGRHDVLCNFWYLFDWATIVFGFCIIGSWIYIVMETGSIGMVVTTLPKAPPFDASGQIVTAYHEVWGGALDRILWLTVLKERLRMAQFAYSMMLIFQFIKAFRGQPKMAQLTRTLINAFEDLVHFIACFVVLFLSFAFTGHLVYGMRMDEWSSSTKCVNAAFKALRGDIRLPEMLEIAPMTTLIWFFLFILMMIFVMMNLLLATVYDHYQLVKDKANTFTGILLQGKDVLQDIWHREGFKMLTCRCLCRCGRRQGFPSHPEMLEELMAKANYSSKEKHHVFRTVLGPKWMRKKTEKHVFAGEVSADHIKSDELQPAQADLIQFGVDQDYVFSLLDNASNYREREFDPEEIHTNQLRELVTCAEVEMAFMRKRLDNCQGHMRLTMHDLARRLESLERCIHTSLQDLVHLAGAAGVPDKTEHQSQLERLDMPPTSCKTTKMLTQTYARVKAHLGQGIVQKMNKERSAHHEEMTRMQNVRQQNNTYARIHSNARLAHAYGEEDRKRTARNHAMHM